MEDQGTGRTPISRRRAVIGAAATTVGLGALAFPSTASAASLHYDVQDPAYGARGDGVTDDARAIQAAIDAADAAGGGTVRFPAGTYVVGRTLTIYSDIHLRGAGSGATRIVLADAADCDILRTDGFASLTGTNTEAGPHRFGVFDLELDGNQSENASGSGIVVYGKAWVLQNVVVSRTPDAGIYSEWYSGGDAMEAHLSGFKVIDAGGTGIEWRGPHDSCLVNGEVIRAAGDGIWLDSGPGSGVGTQFVNVHVWGAQAVAWNLEQGAYLVNCQGEGSTRAHLRIDAGDVCVSNSHFFGGSGRSVVGVVVGDTSSGAWPSRCVVDARVTGVPGPAISFAREGADNVFRLLVTDCDSVTDGTPHWSDTLQIHAGFWDPETRDVTPGWVAFASRRLLNEALPDSASAQPWHRVGTLTATGLGGRMTMEVLGAQGYGAELASVGRTLIVANVGPSSSAPNIAGWFYALDGRPAVLSVKAREHDVGSGRSAAWDIYVQFDRFVGDNGIDVTTSSGATFAFDPDGIGRSDPGAASATVAVFANEHSVQAPLRVQGEAVVRSGSGAPDNVVVGSVGDLYLRSDGGANSTLYVKESGAGTDTGWVAK